jgi:phage shock protein A
LAVGDESNAATFDRMKNKVRHSEAVSQARADLVADDVDDRFAAMEKEEQIDKLLADLKSRRGV